MKHSNWQHPTKEIHVRWGYFDIIVFIPRALNAIEIKNSDNYSAQSNPTQILITCFEKWSTWSVFLSSQNNWFHSLHFLVCFFCRRAPAALLLQWKRKEITKEYSLFCFTFFRLILVFGLISKLVIFIAFVVWPFVVGWFGSNKFSVGLHDLRCTTRAGFKVTVY